MTRALTLFAQKLANELETALALWISRSRLLAAKPSVCRARGAAIRRHAGTTTERKPLADDMDAARVGHAAENRVGRRFNER